MKYLKKEEKVKIIPNSNLNSIFAVAYENSNV